MSQKVRQKPKKSKSEQIEMLIRLINGGKTQAAAASALGIHLRTVQRWLSDPALKERLISIQQEASAIAQSDPVVLSVADIRQQVEEIISYRDCQRSFALEMGLVVQKSTAVLLKAIEKLEEDPEEMSARNIPQLLRAVGDTFEKVSSAWSRATGLDDLLEEIGNDPKVITQGQKED